MSVDGTFQMYELPVKPLEMTLTVFKAVEGPFLSVIVTGPVAPVQVRLKAWPAVMVLKVGLVNSTACATAKAAAATRSFANCILIY